jgi:hypothetical protein
MAKSSNTPQSSTAPADTLVNPFGEEVKRDGGGYKGLVDKSITVDKTLRGFIEPGNLKNLVQAEQYANPRGYVGLAGIQFNRKIGDPPITKEGERHREKSRHMARTCKP